MVIPFSNTKLRVPKGFQNLLAGLSTEVLRSQPRNIYEFAADYFDKLLRRREQGQSYLSDNQSLLDDRYYNNRSFQEDYRVNDPNINNAATRIQSNIRGHQTRTVIEHMKQTDQIIDADQQDLGIGREQTETPNYYDHQQGRNASLTPRNHQEQQSNIQDSYYMQTTPQVPTNEDQERKYSPVTEPEAEFEQEDSAIEKQEQEMAARVIQERYRGSKDRKSTDRGRESPGSKFESASISDRRTHQDFENERVLTPPSTRFSEKLDTDRQDLGGNLTANDQIESGENDDNYRPRFEREPTQLSEDFERHTQVPRDLDFDQEVQPDFNNDENDMDHSNLDKAATRIQASYRGYRIRKELGSIGTHHQHSSSTSPPLHDEYDNANNKNDYHREADVEDDDNAAATKIQAAYRGYRVRKDLDK